MNRRGFLGGLLAIAAAPAIVKASSLMQVRPVVAAAPRDPLLDKIIEVCRVLDEADVPSGDRFMLIPEMWSKRILQQFHDNTTLGSIVTTEYGRPAGSRLVRVTDIGRFA